jgi:hypothetical protein
VFAWSVNLQWVSVIKWLVKEKAEEYFLSGGNTNFDVHKERGLAQARL